MTILILGSSGYLGSNFYHFLKDIGHDIILFDLEISNECDLRIPDNLALLNAINVSDFLFFFAFEIGNSKYIENNEYNYQFIKNNIDIMTNTFNIIKLRGIPFVFISSYMAASEIHTYGLLKKIGEKMTTALGGLNCRLWNVFGGINTDKTRHIFYDMKMACQNGHLYLSTDGEEKRQFIHVDDVNQMLYKAMEYYRDYVKCPYIDMTSFYWIKINELAKIFSCFYNVEYSCSQNKAFSNLNVAPTKHFYHMRYTKKMFQSKIFKFILTK